MFTPTSSTSHPTTTNNAKPHSLTNNLASYAPPTTTTTTKTNIIGQGSAGNEIYISSSASSSSEDESLPENKNGESKIHIGVEYQADLTNYDPNLYKNRKSIVEKETAVWKPCTDLIDDKTLDAYIEEAMNKHSYSKEQALILLFWCNHDMKKAMATMSKYVPKPSEWTPEEKILFEQAFWLYSKNFNKIRQMLPDKTQASLVTYYYVWKRNRQHTSTMESSNAKNSLTMDHSNPQQGSSSSNRAEVNGNGNNEDFEDMNINSDDSDVVEAAFDSNGNQICCNCDFISNDLQSTPKGYLCQQCYVYWKETGGLMRPEYLIDAALTSSSSGSGASSCNGGQMKSSNNRYMTINNNNNNGTNNNLVVSNTNSLDSVNNLSKEARNFQKSLRKPPKGIFLDLNELIELAQSDTDKMFDQLDKKIYFLKTQTTANQKELEHLVSRVFSIEKNGNESIDLQGTCLKIEEEEPVTETTLGWTTDEVMMALLGFNKYGDDIDAISEILKTKSPSSIRCFYNYYRDDLNLDKLIYTNTKALTKKAASIVGDVNKKMESAKTAMVDEKLTKEQPVTSSRSEEDTRRNDDIQQSQITTTTSEINISGILEEDMDRK